MHTTKSRKNLPLILIYYKVIKMSVEMEVRKKGGKMKSNSKIV